MGDRPGSGGSGAAKVAAGLLGVVLAATDARAGEPSAYARLLARHVHTGTVDGIHSTLVDYGALAADPDYAAALRDLAAAQPDATQSNDERFAFWTNAYNLLAIKAVVD